MEEIFDATDESYSLVPQESSFLSGITLVPDEEPTANDEYEQIVKEYRTADVLSEIARYRIYRLRKTENWRKITDENGVIKFNSWEDVVEEVSGILHIGRQNLFDRLRVYEQLAWLGYTPEESIRMISENPSLYTRILNMVLDWDQRKEQPRSITIPEMENASKQEATDYIRKLLDDVATFDSQKEAIKYVSESVLLEPQVEFWYNSDVIYVKYFQQSVDGNGALKVEGYGSITFYPDADMPNWAKEKLEKAFKSIGRWDANKKP